METCRASQGEGAGGLRRDARRYRPRIVRECRSSRRTPPVSRRCILWALGLALAAFTALTAFVLGLNPQGWDVEALHSVERLHSPTATAVMRGVTLLGSRMFLLLAMLLAVAMLFLLRRPRTAVFLGTAVGVADLLRIGLKHVFGRPRPAVIPHLGRVSTFAYPSGHATVTAALALAVCVLLWRTRWRTAGAVLAVLFVVAVSFSRVYLGVHNPSDVLAGWLLSSAWTALLTLVWPWTYERGRCPETDSGATRSRTTRQIGGNDDRHSPTHPHG